MSDAPLKGHALQLHVSRIANRMQWRARQGVCRGQLPVDFPYIWRCTEDDDAIGLRLIFTRDVGHHVSGWFKNPDYERCLHLSTSPGALAPNSTIPDRAPMQIDGLLLGAFFGDYARYAWFESPKSPEGKKSEVRHWRVFCDPSWTPLLPRKEVYSREWTEAGFKTPSELGIVIESLLSP